MLYDGNGLPVPQNWSAPTFEREVFPAFSYDPNAVRCNHDCTFIGTDFVSFDQPSNGGGVKYIDPETWTLKKTIRVIMTEDTGAYLQNKSVDFAHGKLLIGNGRAIASGETDYTDQGAKLYIFHDAADWYDAAANITFENCGDYDVIDVAGLGYKIYGFWGTADDLVFVSCNLFQDVYLIQLGKGTVNMGGGVYAAADAGRYNGSYRIVKRWHNNLNSEFAAHGGQYYNGALYLATNDSSKCAVYRCILNDNATLRFDIIRFDTYQNTTQHPLTARYIDGVCIKDGTMYAQPLNSAAGEFPGTGIIRCVIDDVI